MSLPTSSALGLALPPKKFRWGRWLGLLIVVGITVWACLPSTGIDADFGLVIDNFSNANQKFAELASPDWSYWQRPLLPLLETINMAVIATTAGAIVSLPLCFLASRVTTPSWLGVGFVRLLLNIVRSIPDLLFAALFVSIVSIGALPGILALFLFTIGIIVKLTSEVVDGVDTGPLEAARSTGAGWIQSDRVSVLPQILPSFAGTTLYVFELNIRASAVIGLVGAGGLGELIDSLRKNFHYDRISMVVLEILVVVIVLEGVSQLLRKKLS